MRSVYWYGMDITPFMESEQELKNIKESLQIASELGNMVYGHGIYQKILIDESVRTRYTWR